MDANRPSLCVRLVRRGWLLVMMQVVSVGAIGFMIAASKWAEWHAGKLAGFPHKPVWIGLAVGIFAILFGRWIARRPTFAEVNPSGSPSRADDPPVSSD
jgi:hypothetical protein